MTISVQISQQPQGSEASPQERPGKLGHRAVSRQRCRNSRAITTLAIAALALFVMAPSPLTLTGMGVVAYAQTVPNPAAEKMTIAEAADAETATLGSAEAMLNLGESYHYGRQGVSQDYAKAISYYEKAAALGNTNAMFMQCMDRILGKDFKHKTTQDYMATISYCKEGSMSLVSIICLIGLGLITMIIVKAEMNRRF